MVWPPVLLKLLDVCVLQACTNLEQAIQGIMGADHQQITICCKCQEQNCPMPYFCFHLTCNLTLKLCPHLLSNFSVMTWKFRELFFWLFQNKIYQNQPYYLNDSSKIILYHPFYFLKVEKNSLLIWIHVTLYLSQLFITNRELPNKAKTGAQDT